MLFSFIIRVRKLRLSLQTLFDVDVTIHSIRGSQSLRGFRFHSPLQFVVSVSSGMFLPRVAHGDQFVQCRFIFVFISLPKRWGKVNCEIVGGLIGIISLQLCEIRVKQQVVSHGDI